MQIDDNVKNCFQEACRIMAGTEKLIGHEFNPLTIAYLVTFLEFSMYQSKVEPGHWAMCVNFARSSAVDLLKSHQGESNESPDAKASTTTKN